MPQSNLEQLYREAFGVDDPVPVHAEIQGASIWRDWLSARGQAGSLIDVRSLAGAGQGQTVPTGT